MRTEWCSGAAILVLAASCNQIARESRRPAAKGGGVPQVAAVVVTIRTTQQPANRTTTTAIVIADDLARAMEEVGTWRLFDLQHDRVAFVDDFAKTYRYESLQSLVQRRAAASEQSLSEKLPHAEYRVTGARKPIMGLTATQAVVKLGAYQREIWFASHPLIPTHLFALMQASESPGPAAPMATKVDEAMLAIRAFPLLEHAELPYATSKIVVDRTVVAVDRRNVAEALLQIPGNYRQVKALPIAVRPKPPAPPPETATIATPPTETTTATTATTETTATTATTATTPPPPPKVEEKKPAKKKKAPARRKAKAKAPASHPPASSSHPHDQKTPKGGSRSSSKVRKTP